MNIKDHSTKRLSEISYDEYDKQEEKDRACAWCRKIGSMEKSNSYNNFKCSECGWKIYKSGYRC